MPSSRASEEDDSHLCSLATIAGAQGHLKCLRSLSREDLLKKDETGETAAHHAARGKHTAALRYLCETVPSIREIPSHLGELPAHISVALGDEEACDILLAGPLREVLSMAMQRDTNGTSLLMAAVARGNNHLASKLLKRFGKALATLPNGAKMLPIHVAAAQGNLEMLKMLVKFDSHMVNARDEFGCTPSIYASQVGCLSCVKFLVDSARSQIGTVNSRGQSLLHVACLCGHENIAAWLLDRMGTDAIYWKTADEATVVHCAAYCGSSPVLRLLLGQFSSKKRKQVLSSKDSRGNTPLHLAAIGNHVNAAVYMVENGADIESVNASGHSAVGIASLRGYHELFTRLNSANSGNGKKRGKERRQSAASATSAVSPMPRSFVSPAPLPPPPQLVALSTQNSPTLLAMSPKLSSGYSSGAEENSQVERHRMRFVEDDSTRDIAAQTENDELSERVKMLDDAIWTGLGLSAVEQIDRVLDEVEELRFSPSV